MDCNYIPVLVKNNINLNLIKDFFEFEYKGKKFLICNDADVTYIINENKELFTLSLNPGELVLIYNGETYTEDLLYDQKYCSFMNSNGTIMKALYAYEDTKKVMFCQTNFNADFGVTNVYDFKNAEECIRYLDKRLPSSIELSQTLNNPKKRIVFESLITVNGPKYQQIKKRIFYKIACGMLKDYRDFFELMDLNGFTHNADRKIIDWYLGEGVYKEAKEVFKKIKRK